MGSPHAPSEKHLRPIVALLTDFGNGTGDAGIMKGVIAGIAPDTQIIDITHEIAPQNIPAAAWTLARAYRYFPALTVFICVIDPGVGSSRSAIALHAGDWFFVGPDNGLFSIVLQEQTVQGAVKLTNPAYHLPQISSTFHGRDIFAPVGAHLAKHASEIFARLGPALDPAALTTHHLPTPVKQGNTIDAHILHIDHFGNLITSIPLSMVPNLFIAQSVQLLFPRRQITVEQRRRFFADGAEDGQAFLYSDSSGYLGIAIRNGNAASTLRIGYGEPLLFTISSS